MVIWTDPSKEDLKRIYQFIARDSVYYAKEVIDKILSLSERLLIFPNGGRVVPEWEHADVREVINRFQTVEIT